MKNSYFSGNLPEKKGCLRWIFFRKKGPQEKKDEERPTPCCQQPDCNHPCCQHPDCSRDCAISQMRYHRHPSSIPSVLRCFEYTAISTIARSMILPLHQSLHTVRKYDVTTILPRFHREAWTGCTKNGEPGPLQVSTAFERKVAVKTIRRAISCACIYMITTSFNLAWSEARE